MLYTKRQMGRQGLVPGYAGRMYYVFFRLGGRFEGKYSRVIARNHAAAWMTAKELYGLDVADVDNRLEYAENKIRRYGWTALRAEDHL